MNRRKGRAKLKIPMVHTINVRRPTRCEMRLVRVIAGFCLMLVPALTLASAPSPAADSSAYSRVVQADVATVWKACLSEAQDSQGHRIEAGQSPTVLWLFYDFGDAIHPMSELADYAEPSDALGNRYGRAEIKLTVRLIKPGRTQISANGTFQLLSLPTAAAYLPIRSKGILERKVVDSTARKIEGK